MASWASWSPVAWLGDAALVSTQTPARAPPVGEPTWGAVAGHFLVPEATPSQYCVMTFDQPSLLVPRPLKKACSRGAVALGSPESVVLPFASVPAVPHCEPQNTR